MVELVLKMRHEAWIRGGGTNAQNTSWEAREAIQAGNNEFLVGVGKNKGFDSEMQRRENGCREGLKVTLRVLLAFGGEQVSWEELRCSILRQDNQGKNRWVCPGTKYMACCMGGRLV